MTATDPHRAIEAIFRIESPKLIAGLARIVRDIGLAEELAQDAFVKALELWTADGVPSKPGAWLMTTATRSAIDHYRRSKLLDRKHEELGREIDAERQRALPDHELDRAIDEGTLRVAGGRVLTVTATAPGFADARQASARAAARIDFAGKQFRRDIGWREQSRRQEVGWRSS